MKSATTMAVESARSHATFTHILHSLKVPFELGRLLGILFCRVHRNIRELLEIDVPSITTVAKEMEIKIESYISLNV